jgi:SAM-dependent methyltransferase
MHGNILRFSGFADDYNAYRPPPPAVLKRILLNLAQVPRAKLVIDLGSGTGLSTEYWSDAAEAVIGIEPNDDMRTKAASVRKSANVAYRKGLSSETGAVEASADIVTCSQALHWMEPEPTFKEVSRILRSGGVFAAYDYDWPPTTGAWEADLEYEAFTARISEIEERQVAENPVQKWAKDQHLARMEKSLRFRYTKEILVHDVQQGTADRFAGLLLSQGSVQSLLKSGHSESELGIDRFRARCRELLGETQREWYWSSRVRIGVK